MNDWLIAALLGLVEGLTEFIPVSSTGHLILAKTALGLKDPFWDTFIVLIQLGAILGVVALYFKRLWDVLVGLPGKDPGARRFVISLLVAFFPAVVLGLVMHDAIKSMFDHPWIICVSLIVGGVVLIAMDRFPLPLRYPDAMKLPLPVAFGIGLFQCLAVAIPGISRSGATIVGALVLGADRRAAAEFSFFLAIPTMLGAFVLDAYKSRDSIDMSHAGIIGVGFVVSFIAGILVIRAMLSFVARYGYGAFGWWRIVVGAAGLALIGYGQVIAA